MKKFQQLIIIVGISAASTATTKGDSTEGKAAAAPVRKRTQLRHLSSTTVRAKEQAQIYDPFIGVPRDLQADSSISLSMSMLKPMLAPSLSFSMSMQSAPPTYTSCPLVCEENQICAFGWPGKEPLCYPKCPATFPMFNITDGECNAGDICVHSTFTCGSYADVMNEFCECSAFGAFQSNATGSFLCRTSECGLAAPPAKRS